MPIRIFVALACAACSAQPQPSSAPLGSAPTGTGSSSPVGSATDASQVGSEVAPGTCTADARHCCKSDGTIATPGGCQPSYPRGVLSATTRGPDGSCTPIECNLRCLPADARIATPAGDVIVSRLRTGDVVWSAAANGARIAVPVLAVSSVPVVGAHAILEIELADGRTARASAGHPLVDGVLAGSVGVGARVDGAAVVAIRRTLYRGATWDVLPAGPTGTYWADGVRLGSTLNR